MDYVDLSYMFGLSTMFFGMMAVFFWRKGERLHLLVALLMLTIALEYIKDFVMLESGLFSRPFYWDVMTAVDMVAVPMYAFVLTELVTPGRLTRASMIRQEIPFVILPAAYIITHWQWLFWALVGWAAVYGTFYLVWTAVNIPRYNRHLKERFSYTENVNLNWLRVILYTFYVILGLWILDCLFIHIDIEFVYMSCNLVLWMVISFFLFRHQSVIGELTDATSTQHQAVADSKDDNSLSARIEALFVNQRVYLNPNLKLSDVAQAVGSNRTYVSNFFNRDAYATFYDFVNAYRVDHACRLLAETTLPVSAIAEQSGYNSASVFIRAFSKIKGCTPSAFRSHQQSLDK